MTSLPISIDGVFSDVLRLGILQLDGVVVRESPEELQSMLARLALDCAVRYANANLGDIPMAKAVRSIFHRSGLDPTRYRPSSESLLRRAVKDKGLYFINSAVDVINYHSLRLLLPMGLYDVDLLKPPLVLRVGQAGESYEGIGRGALHLDRFPLLVDAEGPFGSPVSDSMRARVTENCTRLLWVTFVPGVAQVSLSELAESMMRWSGGRVVSSVVVGGD